MTILDNFEREEALKRQILSHKTTESQLKIKELSKLEQFANKRFVSLGKLSKMADRNTRRTSFASKSSISSRRSVTKSEMDFAVTREQRELRR
jgi:hypothetical protein